MKKSDAISQTKRLVEEILNEYKLKSPASTGPEFIEEMAKKVVAFAEFKLEMEPPTLPSDHCQAIMQVYHGGYTFNQWEEDFEKDPKIVDALARRLEYKNLIPEQRIQRHKDLQVKLKEIREKSKTRAVEFVKILNAIPKKKKRKKK